MEPSPSPGIYFLHHNNSDNQATTAMFLASTYRIPTIPSTNDDPKLDLIPRRTPTIPSTNDDTKLDLIPHPTPTRFTSLYSSKTTNEDSIRTTHPSYNHMIPDEMNIIIHEINSLYFDAQQEALCKEYDFYDYQASIHHNSTTTCNDESALQVYENLLDKFRISPARPTTTPSLTPTRDKEMATSTKSPPSIRNVLNTSADDYTRLLSKTYAS